VDELGLGGVVLASVQPDVETRRLRGIIVFRQRHAVRKHRAVDFGIVGVDLLLALIPLRLIALKLSGALDALIEDRERACRKITFTIQRVYAMVEVCKHQTPSETRISSRE